jgi:antirestriction protein ArdC
MILLITTASEGEQCAKAVLAATKKAVEVINNYAAAEEFLRSHDVVALVFDESTMPSDCSEAADVIKHAGAALVVEVNFAIHSQTRILREVQHALRRYHQQRAQAREAARAELSSQITGEVTGILVASQLALYVPSLPTQAEQKIQEVFQIATKLRDRFKVAA